MNDFYVNLPHPPARLHPNEKPHRQERARLTKKARGMAKILALAALNGGPRPGFERVSIRAVWFVTCRRRRDEANLQAWLKAYVDGLVDAGIIVDDSTEHLAWLPCDVIISKDPSVSLTIHKSEPCPLNPQPLPAGTAAPRNSTARRRK